MDCFANPFGNRSRRRVDAINPNEFVDRYVTYGLPSCLYGRPVACRENPKIRDAGCRRSKPLMFMSHKSVAAPLAFAASFATVSPCSSDTRESRRTIRT